MVFCDIHLMMLSVLHSLKLNVYCDGGAIDIWHDYFLFTAVKQMSVRKLQQLGTVVFMLRTSNFT